MQLVMRRSRIESASWNSFKINARMVLTTEENDLINKYTLKNVVLTPGDTRRDLRTAALIAGFIGLLVYFIGRAGMPIALLTFLIFAFLIYHQIREEVRVNDLITGRDFKARSLLNLLQKEYAIRKMSGVFAKVIAQARTWDEPEVIELEDLPLLAVLEPEHALTR